MDGAGTGALASPDGFLQETWALRPTTAARREEWGSLLYDFSTRRLATLRSTELAEFLAALDGSATVGQVLLRSGLAPDRRRLRQLLLSLEAAGFARRASVPAREAAVRQSPDEGGRGFSALSNAAIEDMGRGLRAPICLTWEWTYACNLSCRHCLSSSGRRDERELTTSEAERLLDELQAMRVFYINVGGGEPTIRPDFWHLLDYAVEHDVGVKFSTNGSRLTPDRARRLAATDYVDVQVSLDGATAEVNDRVRGQGSFATAVRALENLASAGFAAPKISVVVTRENVHQLDDYKTLAARYGAVLRLTRLRPAGRGVEVWDELRLRAEDQRTLYDWLLAEGDGVMTGDSFFHLSAYGERLPGMGMCGAGRVVCLIDPIGDVYACPFAMHERFRAGSVRDAGFGSVWRDAPLFAELRGPQPDGVCRSCSAFDSCRGGCMAAKFFTGRRLDDPDPDCVLGNGTEPSLPRPEVGAGHSRPSAMGRKLVPLGLPRRLCDADPVEAGARR